MFLRHDPEVRRRLLAFSVTEIDIALLSQRQQELTPATTLGILSLEHQFREWPEIQQAILNAEFFSIMTAHWFLLLRGTFGEMYGQSTERIADLLISLRMPVHGISLVNAHIAAETSRFLTANNRASTEGKSLMPNIGSALRKLAWLDSTFVQDFYWRRGQDIEQKTSELGSLASRLADLARVLATNSRALSSSLEQVEASGEVG